MKKTIFDGRNLTPIDQIAANVVSTGTHFNCDFARAPRDQREPYATRAVPPSPTAAVTKSVIGKRYGRMEIIGLARDVKDRWVVRCACGMYSLRRFAAIRNPNNNNDCCGECLYKAKIVQAHASLASGKKKEISDLPSHKRPGEKVLAPNSLDQSLLAAQTYAALPKLHKRLQRMTKAERTRWNEVHREKNLKMAEMRKQEQIRRDQQTRDIAAARHGNVSLGAALMDTLKSRV